MSVFLENSPIWVQATECAAPGRLMFQSVGYSRYRDTGIYMPGNITNERFWWVPVVSLGEPNYLTKLQRFRQQPRRFHQCAVDGILIASFHPSQSKSFFTLARTFRIDASLISLDFRDAFDSVDRSVLLETLAHQGMPRKFVNIIRSLYSQTSGRVSARRALQKLPHTKQCPSGMPALSIPF
ncbi:hypothetical protein T265_08684 [Opisthorchis viverrini]|uniref:Uncharacterized protein n=1 Tax=Opisthorchis viverrini TaxID=6198 RepID=A0A075A7H1_OPIVI|nr:hypothetical protein T265_08684 [Opisthorchis viverrini]KER23409.1 hypothetical protein T265_08684 [Opisthorchis viverrini]